MNRDFLEGAIVGAAAACLFWLVAFVVSGGPDYFGLTPGVAQ